MAPTADLLLVQLDRLRGKRVKVFLNNGLAFTGQLKEYDRNAVVVSGKAPADPDSTILLSQVSTFRSANNEEK